MSRTVLFVRVGGPTALLVTALATAAAAAEAPSLTLMQGQSAMLDPGAIRRGPATDVFLLKVSYWWG